jgi:2-C-methyl-D-erythritol 2,4-cyclodiphosphate synthase
MVGFGYDVHRLAEGESLILGGVTIPSAIGTVAHSDGDVLLHAVCDALLGAVGLGDIGEHFPDTDVAYKGISSLELLRRVVLLLEQKGYMLINLDATLVLEKPKILPFKQAMRENIAAVCKLSLERVSIKATTSEKLGFVGAGQGVQAYCVCQVEQR